MDTYYSTKCPKCKTKNEVEEDVIHDNKITKVIQCISCEYNLFEIFWEQLNELIEMGRLLHERRSTYPYLEVRLKRTDPEDIIYLLEQEIRLINDHIQTNNENIQTLIDHLLNIQQNSNRLVGKLKFILEHLKKRGERINKT